MSHKVSEAYKREFAKNLWRAMNEKGWNQATLAERASKHHPVSRQDIHKYCAGITVAGDAKLDALCKVLGVSADDLRSVDQDPHNVSPVQLFDYGQGKSRLIVDRILPASLAAEILALLSAEHRDPIFENNGVNDDGAKHPSTRRSAQGQSKNRTKMDRSR